MPVRRRSWMLIGLTLVLLIPAPAALGADVTLQVLNAPDVIVANDPANMTEDNPQPTYPFSTQVRVTNGEDQRRVWLHAIIYPDASVQGCPQDERAFPVMLLTKSRELDPGASVTIGGSTQASSPNPDDFWPLAVSRTYYDGRAEENVSVGGAEHGMCAVLSVPGSDPACDKPQTESCRLATAPWRSYVREANAAPEITDVTIRPETPRPGQEVLLQAEAADADTQPRPDALSYAWKVDGDRIEGAVARVTLHAIGSHDVELTVTDGFDTVTRSATITVQAEDDGSGPQGSPAPSALLALVVLAGSAATLAMRRRG